MVRKRVTQIRETRDKPPVLKFKRKEKDMIKYFERFRLNGSLVLTVLLSAFALGLAVIINSPDRWICFLAMFLSTVVDIF